MCFVYVYVCIFCKCFICGLWMCCWPVSELSVVDMQMMIIGGRRGAGGSPAWEHLVETNQTFGEKIERMGFFGEKKTFSGIGNSSELGKEL